MTSSSNIQREPAGNRLVQIAYAQNQAEAELLQARLAEVGIPSVLRRAAGFDVPDFLAAGPRAVLAPQFAAGAARDLLELPDPPPTAPDTPENTAARWVRLGLLIGVAVLALVLWLVALTI